MSDTQARLDAIRRWQDWRGSGFPAGDEDGLVVVTELVSAIVLGDALADELERVTAALREIADHVVVSEGEFPDDNCDWHCTSEIVAKAKSALAGGARAAQEPKCICYPGYHDMPGGREPACPAP
jgi:hypothetical protein